ncbi:MAG: putative metallopeptidase [Gemmatimonas sp.]
MPPADVFDQLPGRFYPAHDVVAWIRATFLEDNAPLFNYDHLHLNSAHFGVLWTKEVSRRGGREIYGTAEIPQVQASGWKKQRFEQQITDWFGFMPDFLITLAAEACVSMSHRSFCALVEHELYHCAQQRTRFGDLKFSRTTGAPMFELRGHDVEEFTGVVARYGVVSHDVARMVAAANRAPDLGDVAIAHGCGVCLARVA